MRVTGHCAHPLPLVAAGMDAKACRFCGPRGDGPIYDDLVQLYRAAGIGVVPTIVLATLAVRLNRHPDALEADEGSRRSSPMSDFAWMMSLDSTWRRRYEQCAVSAGQTTRGWPGPA